MAKEEKEEKKKVIIDEDWKQQAAKEKEILAAQEEAEKAKTKAEGESVRHGPLPKGDFAALVSTLVTQAMFAMGMLQVEGQEREPDLEMARYNIDMLETIEEKTKGNLSKEEAKALKSMLNQVRMAYVKASGQ